MVRSVTVVGRRGASRPRPRPVAADLEDTITTRALALIPGLALALTLTACGGSDSGSEGGSASGSSSESASASASPEAAEATGADYAALFTALTEQQGKVQQPGSAEEFNAQADFPDGVSVADFDPQAQTICVQDENKGISGTFTGAGDVGVVLSDGVCGKGEQVSKLVPDPANQGKVKIEGDQEIGQPVADVFAQQSGS